MTEKRFGDGLTSGVMVALGVDQSLTGFALSAVNTADPSNHITWVYKSPYRGVQRLSDIREWFYSKLDYLRDNDHAVYDSAMERGVLASPSSLPLGELAGLVKLAFWDYLPEGSKPRTPLQIAPMSVKKFATGKGTAKKQEMLMQIYKRWGIEFNDDNAADAYSLARIATGYHTSKIEQEVIEKILTGDYRDSE